MVSASPNYLLLLVGSVILLGVLAALSNPMNNGDFLWFFAWNPLAFIAMLDESSASEDTLLIAASAVDLVLLSDPFRPGHDRDQKLRIRHPGNRSRPRKPPPDGLPALQLAHTTALAAAGRLRLPLRSRSWQGQAGEFAGSGTGSSLDFQDHRAYSPGDDPRHINWQAYARTGNYTMKLFREEVRPVVDLIIDTSESMFFEERKAARTAEFFYFITESCAAAGASLAIHAIRGDAAAQSIPPRCAPTDGSQPPAPSPPPIPPSHRI